MFGGALYLDVEKKLSSMTTSHLVTTNNHTSNIEICAEKLIEAIDVLTKTSDE